MIDQKFVLPPRKGVAHAVAAAGYSAAGFRRLLGETAFRQELVLVAIISAAFLAAGVGLSGWIVGFVLFALLVAFEALNTAIEEVVDRVSPERSDFARNAKDLGSFSVACLLAANALHAAYAVHSAL